MEYMGLWFILGIIFMLTWATKRMNGWSKLAVIVYYAVLSYVFIARKEEIYQEYHVLPVPKQFWDTNSEWVGFMTGFFFVPFLLLLVYNYFLWFMAVSGTKKKLLVALSLIPAAVVYMCLLFIFSMYGYRP
ncbi:hypothetical protein [Brevibacillus parabrevis]|uniref:hypothetical protein n=1 Tax=Brevibacillus parabrevis TaxID=54914 RepID=UPI0028D00DE9|nr:hypothetical protein [Brevibacillus parabrevis]